MKTLVSLLSPRLTGCRQHAWVALGFVCLMIAYHMIFGQFFPNRNGNLGHDWVFISGDLAGLYALLSATEEGMVWGSPYLCGGIPGGVDQVSYWLPSIFDLFYPRLLDPLEYHYYRLLMYVAIGFWGTWLMCRQIFRLHPAWSFLAATLFMFNGFVPHRMIIGHHGYVIIMLVPLFAWLLLLPCGWRSRADRLKLLLLALLAGLMTAHMAAVEAATTVPIAITVAAIMALAAASGVSLWTAFGRAGVALVVGLMLSAGRLAGAFSDVQLTAGISFRQSLALPGLRTTADTVFAAFQSLFVVPQDIAGQLAPRMVNMRWFLERHEWEYGITFIPLLMLALGVATFGWRIATGRGQWNWRLALSGLVFALIMALPLALNTWLSPDWSAFVKGLPFISANSTLIRWFAILMLPTIVLSAVLAAQANLPASAKYYAAGVGVFFVVVLNSTANREFYHAQSYNPRTILAAFKLAQKSGTVPPIRHIGAYQNEQGQMIQSLDEANLMVQGVSAIGCFAAGGYSSRGFPQRTLQPGPILQEIDGVLNLKNPACYVYPGENNCTPGDHFRVDQRAEAEKFAAYKPFKFNKSISAGQKIANYVTLVANLLVWFGLLLLAWLWVRACSPKADVPEQASHFKA